jgi:urease accessory protein
MLQARSWLPRSEGSVRLAFRRRGEHTVLDVLHQAGAARARFPKPAQGEAPEAVLLNTAGGLTGGDTLDIEVAMAAGASATITTAAAEKIYRARDGEPAAIRIGIGLEAGAGLAWLPQPTILFDAARLDRRTEVDIAADARFLAVESLIFGRAAMGEDVHRGACRDAWRLRRDGRLVFADTLLLDGAIARTLDRPAALDGARATAFVLYAAPDAAARLEAVRALCEGVRGTMGVSSWNGLLVARAYAGDGRTLQGDLVPLLEHLSGRPLPRVWQC